MDNIFKKTLTADLKITADNILFFDMDGTLVDTNLANYLSYNKAIQSITKSYTNVPYISNSRINRGSLKELFPNIGMLERIIREKEKCYSDYLEHTKLNKSISEVLRHYSKTNQTVLVTNCREDRALMILDYYKLTDKFSHVFFRKTSENGNKINKYENAISLLNISAGLVIAFENEQSEINDAILAGIPIQNILTI